ncbi:hypothetical protein MUP77_03515 [Candidatus Bathyarchaeota archaeon]|nr:hypothetical protein [Candidatus Bathyarchaeota archaeon]
MEKLLLVVNLARPRTSILAVVSHLFGYMVTSTPIIWQIILGVILLFNLVLMYPSQISLGISVMILFFILIVTKSGMNSRHRHPAKNLGIHNLKQEEENLGFYRH